MSELLKPGQVAAILGVTTEVVRGEVNDGRLRAVVNIRRSAKQTLRRFAVEDVRAYCERYSPHLIDRVASCSTSN